MDPNILFVLPENLDLESLIKSRELITIQAYRTIGKHKRLQDIEFKPKNLLKHLKYCYYFLDLIYKRKRYNPDLYKENDFVHISMPTLCEVIPPNTCRLVLNLLVKLEVIEVNNHYSTIDNFSKSYRLTGQYRTQPYRIIECPDPKFSEKIINRHRSKTKNLISSAIEYKNQHDQLLHLEFHQRSAIAELAYNYENNGLNTNDFSTVLSSIADLSNKCPYFKVSGKVNRVFTTVNLANKLVRKHIKDQNGNALISVDIRSSLPYFLFSFISNIIKNESTLYKNHPIPLPYVDSFLKNNDSLHSFSTDDTSTLHSFLDELRTSLHSFLDKSGLSLHSFSDEHSINLHSFFKEVEKLAGLLSDNTFYEFIKKKLKEAGHIYSRKQTKKLFFKHWLNARYNRFSHLYRIIAKEFPIMSVFINYLKKEDSNMLINRLMKMEAELVNNRIVKRIYSECEEPVLYTIFDAILIDKENFDVAYAIMVEEFEKYIGLPSNFEVKDLGDQLKKIEVDGEQEFSSQDYLKRIMEKISKNGFDGESFNLWIKTFHKKSAIKKELEKQSRLKDFSETMSVDTPEPLSEGKKDIQINQEEDSEVMVNSNPGHEPNIPSYTNDQINQFCNIHFNWFIYNEYPGSNELFQKFFKDLDQSDQEVIATPLIKMTSTNLGKLDDITKRFREVVNKHYNL